VNGFEIAAWMAMAAVVAWGCTLSYASTMQSRLREETARTLGRMRQEIQHWQDEAMRARTRASQLERDAETWAAGCKQGRDDVITIVPLLVAAAGASARSDSSAAGGTAPGSGAIAAEPPGMTGHVNA
jgi:hypothetical protein